MITGECGECINYGWVEGDGETAEEQRRNGFDVKLDEADVIATLHQRAAEALPPSARYEIRRAIPRNHGRSFSMAWYHHPDFDADPAWERTGKAGYVHDGGYFFVGRFITPAGGQVGGGT